MGQIFISFERTNEDEATALAMGLEAAGLTTWYYTRDTRPGPSYLRQIAAAITASEAIVVIVSRLSVASEQVTSEIVQGFEQNKPFVPILFNLVHSDLPSLQPEWRGAFRAATSIVIPKEGIHRILTAIIEGLNALGVVPRGTTGLLPTATPGPPSDPSVPQREAMPSRFVPFNPPMADSPVKVELAARFDQTSYPPNEDVLAYWLAELRVERDDSAGAPREPVRVGADIALVLDVSGSMDKPNRYPLLRAAVRRLVSGLEAQDRVSVTLFTDRAQTVIPFMWADEAAEDPDRVLEAMDESGLLFGPKTFLAPGLQLALDGFGPQAPPGQARRVYVLTDGELHDIAECETVLSKFRPQSVEVHAYGFGDQFDAAALKRMISDQIGGTVKPILNEETITQTFAHIAAVNRLLVGQNGKLTITLSPGVVCGDAWVYEPHGRYLGPIHDRRVEHVFGGIESGRVYSLLLEVRLPTTNGPLGTVEAEWLAGEQPQVYRIDVTAHRNSVPAERVIHVRRALDLLQVLRAGNDKLAQLASCKARRELALLERRDPELIAALDKMISALTVPPAGAPAAAGQISWKRFESTDVLTARERQILEADTSTWRSQPDTGKRGELHGRVVSDLNDLLNLGMTAPEVLDLAILILVKYVHDGYDAERASELLEELARHIRVSRQAGYAAKRRFTESLEKADPDVS